MRLRWRIKTLMIGIAITGLALGSLATAHIFVAKSGGGQSVAIAFDPIPMAVAVLSLWALIALRSPKRERVGTGGTPPE
jgi:hypothetical protein